MAEEFLMQMRPCFGAEEKRALSDYMDAGGFLTEFERTEQFEQFIADYTGARHCVVVNNGTISLTLAALACGVRAGAEVIVPNYTMIATPNSICMLGARPVFVDVDPATLCLDPERAESAITDKTVALMLVSANGRYPAAGIRAIEELAQRRNILLIEDAAQSLGSFYPDGRHMGTAGRVGTFSFSPAKIVSTGQGGAIVTDDDEVAARLRQLKDFGRSSGGNDVHESIGYNAKFTDLQAVVGLEQMKKLAWRVQRRKEIYRRYRDLLSGLAQVTFFDQDLSCTTPWFIDASVERRDGLQRHLQAKQIGTRVMYPRINRQQAYLHAGDDSSADSNRFPVSEWVERTGLWLPSMVQITDAQIARVAEEIGRFYR